MSTITIQTKTDEPDETEYLNSSPAMIARIEQSDNDIQASKGVKQYQ